MKRIRHALAGMAASLCVAAPGVAEPARVPDRLNAPIAVSQPDQRLFNEAVLLYSNAVRKEHGRAPLQLDPGLSRAAVDHAGNMARLRTTATSCRSAANRSCRSGSSASR